MYARTGRALRSTATSDMYAWTLADTYAGTLADMNAGALVDTNAEILADLYVGTLAVAATQDTLRGSTHRVNFLLDLSAATLQASGTRTKENQTT